MPDLSDLHLKRLDHLQGIVQRLAGNSFLIKGWSVTLVSAVLGFALKDPATTSELAYLALVPIVLLWGLDAYYLAVERNFRSAYNTDAAALQARLSADPNANLPLPNLPEAEITTLRAGVYGWLDAASTRATWVLYLLLVICSVAVGSGAFLRVVEQVDLYV